MAYISRYIYSNCSTPDVGCYMYSDSTLTTIIASKSLKITIGGISKNYTTNASGVVTSVSTCSWSSTQYYSVPFTGTKNDCVAGSCTVYGSTINLNDGNPVNSYVTSGSYTSYISQADADAQAYSIAYNLFESNKQARVNQLGTCTWYYFQGQATYPTTGGATYTKNNCSTNCDPSSILYPQTTKTGYSANSTVSCSDAVNLANAAAYLAAQAENQSLGQAYANANGTCCCWVADPHCDGCNYYGARERNCNNQYRNDYITATSYCGCNQNCQGTNWNYWECSGSDGKNKTYFEKYNCNGALTGNTNVINCGCNDGQTDRQDTGLTTCIGCTNVPIYKDMNRCSSTADHYFVNGVDQGTSLPNTNACWTGTDYSAYKGVYCYSGTNYDVYQDTNHDCSQQVLYQLRDAAGNVQGYNNNLGASPCQFSAYRSGTFTRNNCPSGYTAGSVSYSNTYYYTGILNQTGADNVADANFNTDGQNYANANATCTAPVTCYTYNIISNNSGVYVTGNYTTCGGNSSSFSFYSSSAYTQVGSICARSGSVTGVTNGSAYSGSSC